MKRLSFALALPLLVCLAGCTRDPKEVAKKYVETGNKYYDKGKFKEASIMYRRALQKDMRNQQAYYHLGLVDLKQGMMGEAQRSFQRAVDIPPKNPDALAKLGDIDLYIFMQDPQTYKGYLTDLRDVSKKLLDLDKNSYDGLRLTGFVELADNHVDKAIEKFKAADQAKPNQPDLIYALVGALYRSQKEDEAERTAKDLIQKHKDYGAMYDMLYMKYASSNRSADAEEILKEKAANNPKNANYLVQLAFHYFLTRHTDEMNAALAKLTSDPKTYPNGFLLAGDMMMRTGAWDRAVQYYQQGEKSDPKDQLGYGKREAEALTRAGKFDQAAQVVARLLKDYPKDAEVVAMHASIMIQSRDPKQIQKAIDELQPLIASTPSNRKDALQVLHYNLGRAYMAKGDSTSLEQARLQLQESIKINDRHIPSKMALAELLLSRGESPKAVQEADDVLKQQPNSLPAALVRTQGLMNMGELDRSRQALNAILQTNPKSNDARYQLAVLDFTEKRYKEAESGFDTLSKANDPRGFFGLVRCKVQEGDYDAAIQMIQDQLRTTPDRIDYRRLLAETEYRGKRFDAAASDYQLLIQKDPSSFNYVRLGDVQRDGGKSDAAIASFNKARELQPTEPYPVLELAVIYDNMGRPEESRKYYEQVLKMQPDNAVALNNLAYSMADQGVDLDKALTYAERARQKLPDNLNVSDTIGLIYLRKNLVDDSARVLGDLVSRAPKSATYHLHYATALYQKGDKLAAKKELDAATRNGPTDKEKLRIQELRQKLS
ncbi:MAG: tetratricopeptide repeat protein [Bryobacteraceae bacterium]|jgi:tetratricopeptide (TPR) repeat protein